jgi:hypothetical protein
MPETLNRTTAFEFLTKLASLLALFYAFLFFYGWIYIVAMYGTFDIDVWMLDIPIYTFATESVFALSPMLPPLMWVLFTIVAIDLVVSLARKSQPQKPEVTAIERWIEGFQTKIRRPYEAVTRLPALVLIALTVFTFLLLRANSAGKKAARKTWSTSPNVHLTFKSPAQRPKEPDLMKANDERRLSILTQTKDLVVVFEREKVNTASKHVYVVARADLGSVFIWR